MLARAERRALGCLSFVATALFALTGCMRTTLRTEHPPGLSPRDWDRRWHHAMLLGAVETSPPVDLAAICPKGWSELDYSLDLMQTWIAVLTLGIYYPSTITLVCAAPAGPPTTGAYLPAPVSSTGLTYPPDLPAPPVSRLKHPDWD